LGKFLRSTSLDELPELWNMLIGDMSLVGPRPLLMDCLPLYSKEQYRRHEVKPGITGLAQVNGRNSLSFNDKILYDLRYIESISLINDLKMLYYTIQIVLTRQSINGNDLDPRKRG